MAYSWVRKVRIMRRLAILNAGGPSGLRIETKCTGLNIDHIRTSE